MLKEETRFTASTVFEGITSLRALIDAKKRGISDREIYRILITPERKEKNPKEYLWILHEGERLGFSVEIADSALLAEKCIGKSHGGIIAECGKRTIPSLLDAAPNLPQKGFYALIEGIEDPYNFGYAIRSLYAAGVDGLILTERNWMTAAGVVARSSAGASEMLPLYTADATKAAAYFHQNGYCIVGADVRTEMLLGNASLSLPLLLIVGGEKRGISKKLLATCDLLVKIPYRRAFDAALSAASAITMVAWEIMRQNPVDLSPD